MTRMNAPQQRGMGNLGRECGSEAPLKSGPYDVSASASASAFDSQDHQPPLIGLGVSVGHQEGHSSTVFSEGNLTSVIPKQESFDPTSASGYYPSSSNYPTSTLAHTHTHSSSLNLPLLDQSINTSKERVDLPPFQPLHQNTQPRSNLRNLYQFEHHNKFSPTMNTYQFPPRRQGFLDMSPNNRMLEFPHPNGQNLSNYHVQQPESNIRTPINQLVAPAMSDYLAAQHYDQRAWTQLPSIDTLQYHQQSLDTVPMERPVQPRTPTKAYASHVNHISDRGQSRLSQLSTSTPSKIKRETSSPRMTRSKRAATTVTANSMTPTSSPNRLSDNNFATSTEDDRARVNTLVAAMLDGKDAEDNEGMIKTWNKLSLGGEEKLREKGIELLRLLKKAQREKIGDKKVVNRYESFETRFEGMCRTLKTQKTVCKHLMEAPYSETVANDPIYAATRVVNNRRVNDQKKHAINVGRKVMGQRGQGKGRKVSVLPQEEHLSDDEYLSDEDYNSVVEEEDAVKPEPESEPQRHHKTKRAHRRRHEDDDSDYKVGKSASKKVKRAARPSRYIMKDVDGQTIMIDSTEARNEQAVSSSPLQNSSLQYEGTYVPTPSAVHPYHNHTSFSHSNGHNNGYHFTDYSHQNNYSSGADPASSDDMNGNAAYSSEIDAYGEDYHCPVVSYPGEYESVPNTGY